MPELSLTALILPLVAGVLATFNPCGFALLPAYLALLTDAPSKASSVRNALRFAAGMGLGFLAVFSLMAVLLAPLLSAIVVFLPYVTLAAGVFLLLLGVLLLSGRDFKAWTPKVAIAPSGSFASSIGYGLTFALVSLSCTIGPFIAVTGVSALSGSLVSTALSFLIFALGMFLTVLVLSLLVAVASSGKAFRSFSAHVSKASGVLVILASLYVMYFAFYEIRVANGSVAIDPVVSKVSAVQAGLSSWLYSLPTPVFLIFPILVTVVVSALLLWRRDGSPR